MSDNTATLQAQLGDRITGRSATVGVIGMGYVGLPLAVAFAKAGFGVLGFDVDPRKVEKIAAGQSYIGHIPAEDVAAIPSSGGGATTDFARLAECDAILICVPTPLTRHREPDMRFIDQTSEQIAAALRPGQLVVLESTTYPGTTSERMRAVLEGESQDTLKAGEAFFLAYSPEREDPGNKKFATTSIPKVVGGYTRACGDLACALYEAIVPQVVRVSSPDAAEATKLLENIFRSVNIALVNELKVVFDRMGINIWEVVNAASSKPFGYMPFYPGPGLGGHCIPIDPFYLTWRAREFGYSTRFIELAGEINTAMPDYVIHKLAEALNDSDEPKPLRGADVLILGAAYKANVEDVRESPTFELIELLQDRGALVSYHDPYVPQLPSMRKYDIEMTSDDLTAERLQAADVVLIATAHENVDYALVGEYAKLIVDTRNAMAKLVDLDAVKAKVVMA